jgi:hypothetical protein
MHCPYCNGTFSRPLELLDDWPPKPKVSTGFRSCPDCESIYEHTEEAMAPLPPDRLKSTWWSLLKGQGATGR